MQNRLLSQQFPLTTRSMVALQRADPLDRDESIALAMDEERYKGDVSVMQPESGRQRELLLPSPFFKPIEFRHKFNIK